MARRKTQFQKRRNKMEPRKKNTKLVESSSTPTPVPDFEILPDTLAPAPTIQDIIDKAVKEFKVEP